MNSLRDFWALARPFWWQRGQALAWVLLLTILGLGIALVQLNVIFSYWNKSFYDALAKFDTPRLYPLMGRYCLLVLAAVIMTVYLDWLRKLLILRWRTALTESLTAAWLKSNAFYRLTLQGEPDNPDQRIAEDVNLLVTDTIDIFRSFISAVTRIASFAVILWTLSSALILPFSDEPLRIPGYLLWFALIYALLGSYLAERIGRVLQGLNYEQQRREADLRADLLRLREHAEQVAMYDGGGHEQQHIMQRFMAVASNWRALMNRERTLGFFVGGYNRVSGLVPVFAALPAFMARSITLGDLMQIETAFSQTSSALSWFIRAYEAIAKWKATVARLTQFRLAIEAAQATHVIVPQTAAVQTEALQLLLPDGRHLLTVPDFHITPGAWVRLSGCSGLGKSTLLRSFAGLWPYHRGRLTQQAGDKLFLPQQPYLASVPLTTLLAYPATCLPRRELLVRALNLVGLPVLVDRLEEQAEWSHQLSGGEQQRLSLARALLLEPACLFLDEATSQLDELAAQKLLAMLRHELPACTVVAVTHQGILQPMFDREICLDPLTS